MFCQFILRILLTTKKGKNILKSKFAHDFRGFLLFAFNMVQQ